MTPWRIGFGVLCASVMACAGSQGARDDDGLPDGARTNHSEGGGAAPSNGDGAAAAPGTDAGISGDDGGSGDGGKGDAGGSVSGDGGTDATGGSWSTVQNHIETWAYDDCGEGEDASAALVRKWVTFAETSCGPNTTKALTDCHDGSTAYCTVLAYLDANKIYVDPGSVPIASSASEDWWLHEPSPNQATRLENPNYGGGNILNQSVSAVDAWFQGYARANYGSFDGFFMDDTSPAIKQELYETGYATSYEIATDAQLVAAHAQMAASMTRSGGSAFLQVDNAVSSNPSLAQGFDLLNASEGVIGLVAEGSPMSFGALDENYSTLLDDMSYTDTQTRGFLVLLSKDSGGALLPRRVQAVTVLLGYSPGHTVSWSYLESGNDNLAVWPEEGIYPTQPVQTMAAPGGAHCLDGTGVVCATGGHNDIEVMSGVYRREFKACYKQGAGFGGCAVIMNDTAGTVTVQPSWLTQSYGHQITMVGGDVQSGGTIDSSGAAFSSGTTTIPTHDAMLLAQ